MTELRSVAAADRYRVFQDALRQRDEQRANALGVQERNFSDQLRARELAETDARLAERRIQDRRDILDAERARQDELRDQQRTRDFIDNDESFVRRRDSIEAELNGARDSRELNESLLLRDLEGDRGEANELRTLDQRADDLRAQLIEREARIVERRQQERADAIRQEIDLRRSLSRISDSATDGASGAERPRGDVLDVSG